MVCTVGYMSMLLSVICQCSIFNRFQAGRPRLWYTIAHDYGTATHLLWCPSGCYEPVDDKVTTIKHLYLAYLFKLFPCMSSVCLKVHSCMSSSLFKGTLMYVFSLFKGTIMYVFSLFKGTLMYVFSLFKINYNMLT